MRLNPDNYFEIKETYIEETLLERNTYNLNKKPKSFCLKNEIYFIRKLSNKEKIIILNLFEKCNYNFSELKNKLNEINEDKLSEDKLSENKFLQIIDFSQIIDFLKEEDFIKKYDNKKEEENDNIKEEDYLAILQYLLIEVSPKLVGEIAFQLKKGYTFQLAMENSKEFIKNYLCLINKKIKKLNKNIIYTQKGILDAKYNYLINLERKILIAKEEIIKENNEQKVFIKSFFNQKDDQKDS